MKLRGGTRFAIGVVLALSIWFGGNWVLSNTVPATGLPRIEPGAVNLIGVTLSGERIVVGNGIAQLVQGAASEFSSPGGSSLGAASGTTVPTKALTGSLRLEPEAVSELIAALAGMDTQDYPRKEIVWEKSDVEQAMAGDEELRARLERQLNTRLDGTPTDTIIPNYLRSGIYVRLPVPVSVPAEDGSVAVTAHVLLPYKTRLAARVANHRLIKDKYEPSEADWQGAYEETWDAMEQDGSTEDVAASLKNLMSESRVRALARPVERLLERVTVLLTERQILGADQERFPKPAGKGYTYTVNLHLTQEGRDRLWRYTHDNPGCQLLFVVDGVAIAAPTVQHEM
ncbi:MAG: hypothetical protein IH851_06840, partial [Armatimonadetes bacterium]|nr:hypothetical protein [Armatimonadota bacterium]